MRFIYKGKDHTKDIPKRIYNVIRDDLIKDDLGKYKLGLYNSLSDLTKNNFEYFNQHPQHQSIDDKDLITAMVMYVTLDILRDKEE